MVAAIAPLIDSGREVTFGKIIIRLRLRFKNLKIAIEDRATLVKGTVRTVKSSSWQVGEP